jgi:pimeloyl-ACP methyl ester carboxylesterase
VSTRCGTSSTRWERRAEEIAREQSLDDLVRGVNAFHTRPDASSVLAAFRGPVHVVRGAHDHLGRKVSVGEYHEVPDAGHYVNLDQPAWFNELLARCHSNTMSMVP